MQHEATIVSLLQRDQAPQTNVPVPPTPLIGREQAIQDVLKLLRCPDIRLLTLTGTAGIGKTRLSLAVATRLAEDFSNGIFFIPLAPISDPSLVIPTIAKFFALKEMGQQEVFDLLTMHLQHKQLLLVLDNFEQVILAAPQIADLLAACPALKVIVTSREVLRIRHEQQFSVFPLALPDVKHLPDAESLAEYAAIVLFVQRAQASKPGFRLTPANAQAIAEICAHLDGLPLAIELAAARIKLLSPQALLARLDHRLRVLTQGPRDLPERQQALRQTIQWSYDLLNAEEQQLFRCLSVFAGGCTLEAVEQVATTVGHGGTDVLNGITSLIDKSLVQQNEQANGESRLMMLETIREYGLECLMASGGLERTRQAHAIYYLAFVHEAGKHLQGSEKGRWLDQIEREQDNLRIVLNELLARGEVEQAILMSMDLYWFWLYRGNPREGCLFLEREHELAKQGNVPNITQIAQLFALSILTNNKGNSLLAVEYMQECLELCQQVGDTLCGSLALSFLGQMTLSVGEYERAQQASEASLALLQEPRDQRLGDIPGWPLPLSLIPLLATANASCTLAWLATIRGEYAKARALAEESFSLNKAVGHRFGISKAAEILALVALNQRDYAVAQTTLAEKFTLEREDGNEWFIGVTRLLQGTLALHQGETSRAHTLLTESVTLLRKTAESGGVSQDNLAEALSILGRVVTRQGDYAVAQAFHEESLTIAKNTITKRNIAFSLEGLAEVVAAQGKPAWAARLWGAEAFLRETTETPLPALWRPDYERSVAAARASLGAEAFAALWATGRTLPLELVLADQVPEPFPSPASAVEPPPASPASLAGLTAREIEVLRLLAVGLTNIQIAERLVISRRTVNAHLRSIYNKLDVTTRTAATRYAFDHHLV